MATNRIGMLAKMLQFWHLRAIDISRQYEAWTLQLFTYTQIKNTLWTLKWYLCGGWNAVIVCLETIGIFLAISPANIQIGVYL